VFANFALKGETYLVKYHREEIGTAREIKMGTKRQREDN
jgi:hypothetical protein